MSKNGELLISRRFLLTHLSAHVFNVNIILNGLIVIVSPIVVLGKV